MFELNYGGEASAVQTRWMSQFMEAFVSSMQPVPTEKVVYVTIKTILMKLRFGALSGFLDLQL